MTLRVLASAVFHFANVTILSTVRPEFLRSYGHIEAVEIVTDVRNGSGPAVRFGRPRAGR
jgi:hypothetical protein